MAECFLLTYQAILPKSGGFLLCGAITDQSHHPDEKPPCPSSHGMTSWEELDRKKQQRERRKKKKNSHHLNVPNPQLLRPQPLPGPTPPRRPPSTRSSCPRGSPASCRRGPRTPAPPSAGPRPGARAPPGPRSGPPGTGGSRRRSAASAAPPWSSRWRGRPWAGWPPGRSGGRSRTRRVGAGRLSGGSEEKEEGGLVSLYTTG